MSTDERRARIIARRADAGEDLWPDHMDTARAIRTSDEAAVDERWQLVDRICRTVFPDFDHWPDRTAHHGMRHTVFRALAATESDNG